MTPQTRVHQADFRWRDDPAAIRPMLAATLPAPLDAADHIYEPKYDGIRALASVEPGADRVVRLWSRLGNDKTAQFADVAAALEEWARGLHGAVLLDGEIVALDERGHPLGFQHLQGRIHRKSRAAPAALAYVVFDLLRDGDVDLRSKPLRERRARLEALLDQVRDPRLRIGEQAVGDGRSLHARALAAGWEGLIVKRRESPYTSGRRSAEWRKLKLVRRQSCVVGGWTDPRGSRPFFGALLLGVHDDAGLLQYVGHTGAGFTDAELGRLWKRLRAIETRAAPFARTPRTNAKPHWVRPMLVADVKFTEWTADARLRHPTYVSLRDDVKPERVRREPDLPVSAAGAAAPGPARAARPRSEAVRPAERHRTPRLTPAAIAKLLDEIDAIQGGTGSGVLHLPDGDRLDVTNLRKVFWPARRGAGPVAAVTKGDIFRHYVRMAPYLLPVLVDRPLVMKRYPNGIEGKSFYQHRAPGTRPAGVRVEYATSDTDTRPHIIGGSLATLLYSAQLAALSQDPWFSRIQSEASPDHVALDLDPPDGLPFGRVLDVARWVRDELHALKAPCFAKTSGAGGLHLYVPVPPGTPYQAGLLFCQIVATVVARKHPKAATIERSLHARGRRVYVDYLQNARGKTLASAYSVRASEFAGVSMPVTWDEVDEGVMPQDFTIRSAPARLAAVGDLWAPLRRSKGADLRTVVAYAEG